MVKIMGVSLVSLEKIKIGGMDQWIYIRTKNIDNPILFYLHGGPGSPVMHLFRKSQADLENHFIVVQWEQRGAGKSYSNKIPEESMNLNQFISDLHELILILLKRFKKKKLYLVGHSWGSIIGILTVKKFPDLFYAYVGISQPVNMIENEKISYRLILKMATKLKNKKAIKQLKKIGVPFEGLKPPYKYPYKNGYNSRFILYKWLLKFGGVTYSINCTRDYRSYIQYYFKNQILFKFPFSSKEYTLLDKFKIALGGRFSMRLLTKEILSINLFNQIQNLEVPVYILMGKHDYNISPELAKNYFDILKAPKREFIWFEKSAHSPNFEEPEKFNRLLIERILPENF